MNHSSVASNEINIAVDGDPSQKIMLEDCYFVSRIKSVRVLFGFCWTFLEVAVPVLSQRPNIQISRNAILGNPAIQQISRNGPENTFC